MKQATICIDELTIETLIGIHPWEQKLKQKLIFDLQCFVDTEKASDTDDLSHALDYEALSQQLSEFISANHFQLIETLAERSAEFLLNTFPIEKLILKLSKPGALSQAKNVAITIQRQRGQILD